MKSNYSSYVANYKALQTSKRLRDSKVLKQVKQFDARLKKLKSKLKKLISVKRTSKSNSLSIKQFGRKERTTSVSDAGGKLISPDADMEVYLSKNIDDEVGTDQAYSDKIKTSNEVDGSSVSTSEEGDMVLNPVKDEKDIDFTQENSKEVYKKEIVTDSNIAQAVPGIVLFSQSKNVV